MLEYAAVATNLFDRDQRELAFGDVALVEMRELAPVTTRR